MKKQLRLLFALTVLFSCAIACSTPTSSDASTSAVVVEQPAKTDITTRGTKNATATSLTLAKKWQNEGNSLLFLDLKIDGTFQGQFEADHITEGTWSVSADETTLSLKGSDASDGKGAKLNVVYSIIELSFDQMQVQTEDGQMLSFISASATEG